MDDETQLVFLEEVYRQGEMEWIAAHHRVEESLFAISAFLNRDDPAQPPEENPGIH